MDSDEHLVALLNAWFDAHGNQRGVWRTNVVGILLKNRLKKLQHWKSKPRGDCDKAFLAMKATLEGRTGE